MMKMVLKETPLFFSETNELALKLENALMNAGWD